MRRGQDRHMSPHARVTPQGAAPPHSPAHRRPSAPRPSALLLAALLLAALPCPLVALEEVDPAAMAAASVAREAPDPTGPKQPPYLPAHSWRKPAILLFGDSLTELAANPKGGWAGALTHRYVRRADVINRGFGGYTTRQAVQILPEMIETLKLNRTALAVVWFGANDAANPEGPQYFMGVPISEYKSNLKSIITDLRAAGVANVMLVTPTPVDEEKRVLDTPGFPPDRTMLLAGQYAEAVVGVAHSTGVPVLNMYAEMQAMAPDGGWSGKWLMEDGLHFNPMGQAMAYKLIINFIDVHIPEASAQKLPFHHYSWEELNYRDTAPQFEQERAEGARADAEAAQKLARGGGRYPSDPAASGHGSVSASGPVRGLKDTNGAGPGAAAPAALAAVCAAAAFGAAAAAAAL